MIEFNKFKQFFVCFVEPHKNIFLIELIISSFTFEYLTFFDKYLIISEEERLQVSLYSFIFDGNFNSSFLSSKLVNP